MSLLTGNQTVLGDATEMSVLTGNQTVLEAASVMSVLTEPPDSTGGCKKCLS
jgi:hypothetical protein